MSLHRDVASNANLGLAPMEGVSDFPFRLWLSLCSNPTKATTPFLRVTDTYPKRFDDNFAPEITWANGLVDYKLCIQFMAADPLDFLRSASMLPGHVKELELNCGCPSSNPVGGGAGSSLLKDVDSFKQFIETICDRLDQRQLAVKIRTGFHSDENFYRLIESIKDLPLAKLTIHGRTKEQRYSSFARWDLIEDAIDMLPFQVVASGDITCYKSLSERLKHHPKISQLIIGRGALRNPWIFDELRQGQAVRITPTALIQSLLAFVKLTDMFKQDPDSLKDLLSQGIGLEPCGTSESAWRTLHVKLDDACARSKQALELQKHSFNRLKLLWNYLRGHLPEVFFNPLLLRTKSIAEFEEFFQTIQKEHASNQLELKKQNAKDWIYTSDKKAPPSSYQDFLSGFKTSNSFDLL